MKLALCMGFIWPVKSCSLSFDSFNEAKIMTASRRVLKFTIGKADLSALESIARSRTEPVGRVERARVLLAYRQDPSFYAVGQALGMHHQKVRRYIERAKTDGAIAALDDRPRPGKEPTITVEAKTWVVALACRKPKELGYPHEVWTTRLLADHAREHGPRQGHGCLSGLVQGTVCKILDAQEVKPHKVRYYLERRVAHSRVLACGRLQHQRATAKQYCPSSSAVARHFGYAIGAECRRCRDAGHHH